MGKIHTSPRTKRVPTPQARIHIQQFVLIISSVVFEFDFYESGKTKGAQQTNRGIDDSGLVHRLHKGAKTSKFHGELTDAPGNHRRFDYTLATERRKGELRFSASGNQFL